MFLNCDLFPSWQFVAQSFLGILGRGRAAAPGQARDHEGEQLTRLLNALSENQNGCVPFCVPHTTILVFTYSIQ